MIPTGIQPKLLIVGTDQGRPLTPQEVEAVHKHLARRTLAPQRRQAAMPMAVDDECEGELDVPRRLPARRDDDKRVKLGFGKYAELEVDVDGKTRSAMATTFMGGVLVALGVFIAAMFGIKKRS